MDLLLLAQGGPSKAVEHTDVVWVQAPDAWIVFLIGALVAAFVGTCYLLEPRTELTPCARSSLER